MREYSKKSLRRRHIITKSACMTFVFAVLFCLYMPLVMVIIFSFTQSFNVGTWNGFSLNLYKQMLNDDEMMRAVGNTFMVAGISGLAATVIGSVSAVGIHYLRRFKKVALLVNEITVINADIVTAVALLLLFRTLNIQGGYFTLIVSHTVITIPYVILSVMPRLARLNPSIYDAGQDLGAGAMRTVFTVVFPQLVASMVSGFILSFILSIDDFVITKFTNGFGEVMTISTYIYSKIPKGGLPPVLRALSTVLLAVTFIILTVFNLLTKRKDKKLAAVI